MTTNPEDCIACLRGLIGECNHGTNNQGTRKEAAFEGEGSERDLDSSGSQGIEGPGKEDGSERTTARSKGGRRPRRNKRDAALRDQQSTGRKRAARLYPLDRSSNCEWAGIQSAGGGNHPIEGCGGNSGRPVGKQEARHHGPDKNTLNNEVGNVHRICHSCHNRWHALNDPDYVWGTKTKGD